MSKDLEQLRLNMITSMMELNYEALVKVKNFMASQEKIGWKEQINDETVEFIDLTKTSKIRPKKTRSNKPSIVFL